MIPPAKKDRIIAGVVMVSMVVSALFTKLPGLNRLSSGLPIIVLTILVAGAAAILFPVGEKKEESQDET